MYLRSGERRREDVVLRQQCTSGGGPGIAIAGNADLLDNWSGGAQVGDFHLVSTDGNGVESYTQISKYNSGGAAAQILHKMRVKRPTVRQRARRTISFTSCSDS